MGRKLANVWVSIESVDCHQFIIPQSIAFTPNLRGYEQKQPTTTYLNNNAPVMSPSRDPFCRTGCETETN
ncbi:hypothetical protein SH467x_004010 [Pirellulaceae bacterium SH467]